MKTNPFLSIGFSLVFLLAGSPNLEAAKSGGYDNTPGALGYNDGKAFEVPPALEAAVTFWRNIYTQHPTSHTVIHDNQNLDIVYTVVDFTGLMNNPNISEGEKRRIREEKTEEVKNRYRMMLKRLDEVDMEILSASQLTEDEKRLAQMFKNSNEEYRFDKAAGRLRGQVGQRNEFLRGLVDSGAFLPHMEEIFRSYRLPVELVRLPFVESMFNTKAYSKAHASGIWQFIPSTGRLYLRIDSLVDERNDPILATHAAARLLMGNYQALQTWPLALTAYNHGRAGMARAVHSVGTQDLGEIIARYKNSYFGFASRNFYAQFLAAIEVEKNYRKYFGTVGRLGPLYYDHLRLPDPVSLKTLAEYTRVEEEEIIDLNPALADAVINSMALIPTNYDLKIPKGTTKEFLTAFANIPREKRMGRAVAFHWHRVKKGESLSEIARSYRTSANQLMLANGLTRGNRIYAGQLIKIPEKGKTLAPVLATKPNTSKSFVNVARAPKATVKYPEVKVLPLQVEEEKPVVVAKAEPAENPAEAQPSPTPETAEAPSLPVPVLPLEPSGFPALFALAFNASEANAFELIRVPAIDPNTIAWHFYYQLKNEDAPKDIPFSGNTTIIEGETPSHLAEWCGLSTPQLRRLNNLKFGQDIASGKEVHLDCLSSYDEFHKERLTYHRNIQQESFKSCSPNSSVEYQVKDHDNLWLIAREKYQVPAWLIQSANPDLDLSKGVKSGEKLIIPICQSDTPGEKQG